MSKVKEFASWVDTMIKTPVKKRREWVRNIIENLKKPETYKKNPTQSLKEMGNLGDLLEDKSKFELAGFSANLVYVKHDKRSGDTDEDLECIFVHPWGSPKLLYKHKTLPVIIIVGEDLRLDESVLDDLDKNSKVNLRGFTG